MSHQQSNTSKSTPPPSILSHLSSSKPRKPIISIPASEIHATVELTPHASSTTTDSNNTTTNGANVTIRTTQDNLVAELTTILRRPDLLNKSIELNKKVHQGLMDIADGLKKDRYLAACSIFLAARENKDDSLSVRTLADHKQSNLILSDLYNFLSAAVSVLGLDNTPLAKELMLAQKKIIICDCLFDTYSDVFAKSFESNPQLFYFIWMLFLMMNVETGERILDFEEQYCRLEALLCFVWQIVPPSLKTETLPPSEAVDFMVSVPDHIRPLPEKLLTQLLNKNIFVKPAQGTSSGADDDASQSDLTPTPTSTPQTAASHFDQNEFSPLFIALAQNVQKANEYYDRHIQNITDACDFDARLFAINRKMIGASETLTSSTVVQMDLQDFSASSPAAGSQSSATSSSQQDFMFSPAKPARSNPTPLQIPKHAGRSISPMDATLHSIRVLTENLRDESAQPDDTLKQYFAACDRDLTADIVKMLDKKMLCVHLDNSMSAEAKSERLTMIRKLFFKTLRCTLQEEEKRQQTKNFTALLQNDRFMTSLLACSVEAVMFGYNMKHCMRFEDVIKSFDLKPFDFVKIIESFVLNSSSWLSSPFKRHFRRVEEVCIDSLGWDPNGPLFSQENYHPTGEENAEMPQENAPVTPARKKRARAFQAFTTSEKKVSPSLDFFFRKVNKLLALRIRELCSLFDQAGDQEMQMVWKLVLYVLNNKRTMMIGRHLDHLIICSLYIVLNKIAKAKVRLSEILLNYRYVCEEHRHMSTVEIVHNLTHVALNNSKYGDIVMFYNQVFIPSVKDYVKELHAMASAASKSGTSAGAASGTSEETIDSSMPEMPNITSPQRRRIAGSSNVFVSPLRKSPRPRNQPLYSFGTHNTQKHVPPPISQQVASTNVPKTTLPEKPFSGEITSTQTILLNADKKVQRPNQLKRKLFETGDASSQEGNSQEFKRQALMIGVNANSPVAVPAQKGNGTPK